MLETTLQEISDRVDLIAPRAPMARNPIDAFQVAFNSTTLGMTITFTLVDSTGISSILLKRNSSQDIGSAVAINTWDAAVLGDNQKVAYSDNDQAIKGQQSVFYWLECHAFLRNSPPVEVGPQTTPLTLDQEPPNPIADFSVSRSAVSGGVVKIGVSFQPALGDKRFGTCKITVAGYNGIAATVEIAEGATSPFSFALEQTGETVTFSAIAVSQNGIEASSGPTAVLTLGATASVPAKLIGASATELTTGLQITFPSGAETNITLYQVFRGPRGQGFAAASSIGTVTPTGASAYTFLDAGGLGGIFEWYVFAVNAAGNGAASVQILPNPTSLTSADQPVNSPSNTTNQATVDSFDAGTDATIRIYGTGGPGSSWTSPRGFGTITLAGGSIPHKSYNTIYYVVWDTVGLQYLAFTSFPSVLPDNFAWAGKVTTVIPGGTGGTGGGGGSTGGGGGLRGP